MLKHLLFAVSMCCLVLLMGCAEESAPVIDCAPQLTFRFETTAVQHGMRTTLLSSDNVQHVSYVQLYIFKGMSADAPCIVSRNVRWTQPVGATAEQAYALPLSEFSPDGSTTYTFLAVGLDDDPTHTTEGAAYAYGLPDAVTIGTTLGNAVAQLAKGRTATDLSRAELFAGTATLQVDPTSNNAVTIELYRRVVGVQVYVTDIPTDVTDLQLHLYSNQHTDVPLVKQPNTSDGIYADHGTQFLPNSTCLLDLPVTDATLKGATLSGTQLTKQVGSVLSACYLLPIEAPTATDSHTLQLKAYKGTTLYKTYNVALGTMKARNYVYPLRANCFYTIGVLNKKENEPVSLGEAEGDIVIEVEPNFEKDHEYEIF